MIATHADYASEVYTTAGPTGRFRVVVEAVVKDAGGNVLAGPGAVEKVAARKFRVPVSIVPTVLGGECVSADALVACHLQD